MNSDTFSVFVKCWREPPDDITRIQLTQVDSGDEVLLSNSTFLLRISYDEKTSIERCLIRHVASGREAYVQSGPNFRAFVVDCLLSNDGSNPGS